MTSRCQLCGRPEELTDHHLIPRSQHSRLRRVRNEFDVEAARHDTARLCSACHRTVHSLLTDRELAEDYHSLESLRSHPGIRRFVRWARRQKSGKRISVRRPKR
jgi:5-methylcytosine-specific restriction endonuclease McrA